MGWRRANEGGAACPQRQRGRFFGKPPVREVTESRGSLARAQSTEPRAPDTSSRAARTWGVGVFAPALRRAFVFTRRDAGWTVRSPVASASPPRGYGATFSQVAYFEGRECVVAARDPVRGLRVAESLARTVPEVAR